MIYGTFSPALKVQKSKIIPLNCERFADPANIMKVNIMK